MKCSQSYLFRHYKNLLSKVELNWHRAGKRQSTLTGPNLFLFFAYCNISHFYQTDYDLRISVFHIDCWHLCCILLNTIYIICLFLYETILQIVFLIFQTLANFLGYVFMNTKNVSRWIKVSKRPIEDNSSFVYIHVYLVFELCFSLQVFQTSALPFKTNII